MSSNEISVEVLQRVARYRKLVRIIVRAEREETLNKDDTDFLNQLSFTMARELINGVQFQSIPNKIVLGDMTIEPRLREIKTAEFLRYNDSESLEKVNSIYF